MQASSLTVHLQAATVYLVYAQGTCVRAIKSISARETSKLLIPTIASLLAEQDTALDRLSYIACYRGPGSFTTVRSMIVTVNGLSFATNIPLIGFSAAELPEQHTVEEAPAAAVIAGYTIWSTQTERAMQLTPLYTALKAN